MGRANITRVATPCRRTFSGAASACLLGAAVALGGVSAVAEQAAAADMTLVVGDACPVGWPTLGPGTRGGSAYDGNANVLVGGDLTVGETADGAEGIVVVRGTATFQRGARGPYEVGVTSLGSGIAPHPDSDMLVVGGDLTGSTGVAVDAGRGLGADAVVGGVVAAGTEVELHGGRLDADVRQATEAYDAALDGLGAKAADYAARPATGTVDVTETAITLTGDGVSDPQVFAVDGAGLGSLEGGVGRSLQVLGVPDGAAVVVNLTGPAVDLDVDSLLAPTGEVVDPTQNPYFADLSTHLLWNAPGAATVDVGGLGQLPGSLLVPGAASTTTLAGAGTNGRILVAGNLVHTGAGHLHSYPFLRDPDLTCGPDLAHFGTVTLNVVLKGPPQIVREERVFQGDFACRLDGENVTPGDGTWRASHDDETQVLSGRIPVGAVCELGERLGPPPRAGWLWDVPEINPEKLVVEKRDPRGFRVTNSVVQAPPPPVAPPTEEPTEEPTETPTTEVPDPLPTDEPTDEPTATAEPTGTPPAEPEPTALPTPGQEEPEADQPDAVPNAGADPPGRSGPPGPLTTTAPFTLRGAFVWGPLLLLSVLALRLRAPWQRRRHQRLH